MAITRRQFIKYVGGAATALGLTELQILELTKALANPNAPKVLWLQGGACTGCTTSFANVITTPAVPWVFSYPTLKDGASVVVDPIPLTTTVEDAVIQVIDLHYQQTIQGPSGDLAIQDTAGFGLKSFFPGGTNAAGPFVVAVEGVIPNDKYCTIGRDKTDATPYRELGIQEVIQKLASAPGCAAMLGIGTCSCFGGWPGGRSDDRYAKTGVVPLSTLTSKLTVNVPGCPVQPEVLLLTIAGAILYLGFGTSGWGPGFNALLSGLDANNRPLPYFADILHRGPTGGSTGDPLGLYGRNGCPHYQQWSDGLFATKPGDDGCLMTLGCKGISTKTPCNIYQWNNHQTYCVKANHPCYGCMEKGAPDKMEPFVKI